MNDPLTDFSVLQTSKGQRLAQTMSDFGLGQPWVRVIVGFAVGTGLSFLFQPNFAFDDQGMRPFSLLSSNDPRATFMPWYGPGVIFALLFGVFF